jgi:phytoene dehydrogenase-like protein
MGAITQAMARAAEEAGATIHTGSGVDRILVDDDRRVRGVRLSTGEEVQARVVLSNADPTRTYLGLLEPDVLPTDHRQRVERLSVTTSYLKMHCVLDRLPDLSGHLGREAELRDVGYLHLAPSLETFRDAHAEAMAGRPASRPVVHIQIPTVYDTSIRDGDGHMASVWAMYAPPVLKEGTWDERRDEVGRDLLAYIDRFIPGFTDGVREWMLLTPKDMEDRIGLTRGNIRHLDMIPDQFLGNRPLPGAGYATPIEGLYLCGAGTHPGGEVSGGPGHNAAHAVLRALASRGTGG